MLIHGKIAASVLNGLAESMAEAGLDLFALSARIGFAPHEAAHEESGLIPWDPFLWLLETAARESGDDSFGSRFAESHHRDATSLVYYIVENAPDLRAVFNARLRFSKLVASGYTVSLVEKGHIAIINWHFPKDLPPHTQFVDYALTLAVQRIRHLLGSDWSPLSVSVSHSLPRNLEHFNRVFGPNIRFGAAGNSIELEASVLDRPLPNANSKLLRELERGANALIATPEDADILHRATVLISGMLPNGIPGINRVAGAMNVSKRTLQRRLEENATSFSLLVDDVQARTARHLLSETDLPLVEIALLLGFSEASSFSRAARQWLGESPMEFRQKNRVK